MKVAKSCRELAPGPLYSPSDPMAPCRVCPRECGVNRHAGEAGFCGLDNRLHLAWCGPHLGEEPCFSGKNGVGNFFFSGCNMACVYCQNHQISQEGLGDAVISPKDFANTALAMEKEGLHAIGLVTPSPQVPMIREGLLLARNAGLSIPVIYNTSAYDAVDQLKTLEGLVDIYLPDVKYADNALARKYSGVKHYVEVSRDAVLEMYRQVGDIRIDPDTGLAGKGLWARHLVMPGGIAGTWEALCFLALEVSTGVGLSLMAQYAPVHKAGDFSELSVGVSEKDYEAALDMARDLGFDTVLCQDLGSAPENALPDFQDAEKPFRRF